MDASQVNRGDASDFAADRTSDLAVLGARSGMPPVGDVGVACLASLVHTVVAGILIAGGRVLLTLRSAERRAYPSTWALPGGHVEPGELEAEALRRELREELGIDVLGCDEEPTSRLHLTAGRPSAELHLSTWRIRTWRGQPSNLLRDEHDRIAWLDAGELDGLPWAHPQHRQMLQDMLSRPHD